MFEEAVSLAASILMEQDTQNSVLDLLFVERQCVLCSTGSGLPGKGQMLEVLASVETCRNRTFSELADLVKSHVKLLSGIVILLIDFDEERAELLRFLGSNNIPSRIFLLTDNLEEGRRLCRRHGADLAIHILELDSIREQVMIL